MSLFIAHRGLSALAPENTHAAFDLAWAHDCAGIELDVQVSRDGQVVAHHDPDLQRTAGVAVTIAAHDYADLATYSVGQATVEQIPLLADVLEKMPAGKCVQVEVKPEVACLDAVVKQLQTARRDVRLFVIDFDFAALQQLHSALPEIPKLWLLSANDARDVAQLCAQAQAAGFAGLDVQHDVIDALYVRQVHDAGLLLGCWTVNDAARMRQLAAWGVDIIASDCAHIAQEGINE